MIAMTTGGDMTGMTTGATGGRAIYGGKNMAARYELLRRLDSLGGHEIFH